MLHSPATTLAAAEPSRFHHRPGRRLLQKQNKKKFIYLWAIANKFLQAVKQNKTKTNSSTYGQLQKKYH
eukprot:SAG31_NODE_15858_length_734_cov_1.557480_1_plen_68_part_01